MIPKLIRQNPVPTMIIAIIMLASNSAVAKVIFESVPVPLFMSIRYSVVGLLFLLVAMQHRPHFSKEVIKGLFFQSVLQVMMAFSWLVGVSMTQAITASILFLLTPIAVYIFSVRFLGEPPSIRALAGTLIALTGGLLMFGAPALTSTDSRQLLGNGLVFFAAVALAGMIVHTKYLYKHAEPPLIVGTRFTVTGVIAVIVALTQGDVFSQTSISLSSSLGVAWAVSFAGFFGLYMFYEALKYIRAEDTASLSYIDPLAGTIFGVLLLGEIFTPITFVAALIIVTGVLVTHPIKLKH